MRLPRFHLATVLLACAMLSFFLGANLCIRTEHYVEFMSMSKAQEPIHLTQSELYVGAYQFSESWIGWPAPLTGLSRMTALVDAFSDIPISAAEIFEVQSLARTQEKIVDETQFRSKWFAADFRQHAPLIYHNIPDFSDKTPRSLQFMSATDLMRSIFSLSALAINIATALAITLAVAALCEFLLRRKKKTPPVG